MLLGEHLTEKSLSQLTTEQDSSRALRQGRGTALLLYPGQGGRRHRQSAEESVNALHSSPPITQCSMLMNFPGALNVLTKFPFSCRNYNDSCFLDSPLYPELADVQWYGQEKAKPGTLV